MSGGKPISQGLLSGEALQDSSLAVAKVKEITLLEKSDTAALQAMTARGINHQPGADPGWCRAGWRRCRGQGVAPSNDLIGKACLKVAGGVLPAEGTAHRGVGKGHGLRLHLESGSRQAMVAPLLPKLS